MCSKAVIKNEANRLVIKKSFSYYDYEKDVIDNDAVQRHLELFLHHFQDCSSVLDVGSGTGLFLRLLANNGIKGTGLENDENLVRMLKADGLSVILGDASSVWPSITETFDGLFCSHLIEHLSFEDLLSLIEGASTKMRRDAVVVFAFPNPESIEMQLFHFWKDPQHVRFYHPQILIALLKHYGFILEQFYSQGTWGPFQAIGEENINIGGAQTSRKYIHVSLLERIFRPLGRKIKDVLGINQLEVEADYMRKLRKIGREAVVVARKL